jgi:AcrR family transcriptional regulator
MATRNAPRAGDGADGDRARRARNNDSRSTERAQAEALRELVVSKVAEKVAEKIADKAARHKDAAEKLAEKAAHKKNVAEKIAQKAARQADVAEKLASKAARGAEVFDRAAERLDALDLWTRASPRTRKPRFSRDEIAETAIAIADREGFGAVSMRRIAAELDAGTMTLYHYVRTKDELLSLLTDTVMGEVVVPEGAMPHDWRAAVTMIAERTRAALERHPWILDIAADPPLGPNSVRHFDQSLEALASLPLSLGERLDIVTAVDSYVFGYCLHARHADDSGPGTLDRGMIDYVNGLIATGAFPQLRALTDEFGVERAWLLIEAHHSDPGLFARNLHRLLDGVQSGLADDHEGSAPFD